MKPPIIVTAFFAAYILASRLITGIWSLSFGGNLDLILRTPFGPGGAAAKSVTAAAIYFNFLWVYLFFPDFKKDKL